MSIPAAAPVPATVAGPASDQPRVAHNRWDQLSVPPLGSWTPTMTVSLVVPAYGDHDELPLTLASLAAQRYPPELLEIVVVDDGSDPPLDVPAFAGDVPVRAVRQVNEGFGAGKARSTGGFTATGEILLFVDADVVLDPHHVEAHARWHHTIDHAVTMGFRTFVDFADIGADDVTRAAADGGVAALVEGREQQDHDWIEKLLGETDQLREPRGDLWRVAVGSSIAVPSWLFREVGGFPVFGIRGCEDTIFGYRLFTRGAVLVPDREAHSWHQGPRHLDDQASRDAAITRRLPVIANHAPARNYRRSVPGRAFAVPYLAAEVPVSEATTTEEEALRCIESLLANDTADVAIGVTAPAGDPVRERLDLWMAGQDRVTVTDAATWSATHPYTPIRLTVPPAVRTAPDALVRVRERLAHHRVGALHVVVPGMAPDAHGTVEAVSTRAVQRAARLTDRPGEVAALVGELFEERWVPGEDLGIGSVGKPPPAGGSGTARDARIQRLEAQLGAAEDTLARLRRRRVLRIADAFGQVARARRPGAAMAALRGLARTLAGRDQATTARRDPPDPAG
ncbi:glycosyltransferase [Egibacter rhizosphaerae]|uniref:Glycosyltransferase n=1 Tax=Egibacter rhizosphaerae TaxID=1670831 RepID=A0A411YHU3_9ACTN|nr:glycosyltransferase family 2 protein [Egibacter rhizosphaerae]QBI20689.1 glycosyltransferase [Egibacter rhizosphaerae]